ncbi:unnamed protein product [Dovyalis caffra]|uniref:Uncharacterized protein n=1 Tax=Dovyalis caffra TaxID=77055 RepID=A0AAV1R0V5_9ROSI|nr:unnamed protein product [Dovyalis caffra]
MIKTEVLKLWLAGTSANIVDANLGILRGRIAEVQMKERLDKWCKLENGWNYQSGYDHKRKRDAILSESLELMGFAVLYTGRSLAFKSSPWLSEQSGGRAS